MRWLVAFVCVLLLASVIPAQSDLTADAKLTEQNTRHSSSPSIVGLKLVGNNQMTPVNLSSVPTVLRIWNDKWKIGLFWPHLFFRTIRLAFQISILIPLFDGHHYCVNV